MLSGCIITQDEEPRIATAIESILPVVDEIIVLDGGSTDRTLEVASAFPKVKVLSNPFNPIAGDSFADQRNKCKSYSQGSWVLFIDADEFYPEYVIATIPRLMADAENDAYAFIRKSFVDGVLMNPFNLDYQVRLFRRYCKYEGEMHEGEVGFSNMRFCNLEIMHYKTTVQQQEDNERCWNMGQTPPLGWVKVDNTWVWQPGLNPA